MINISAHDQSLILINSNWPALPEKSRDLRLQGRDLVFAKERRMRCKRKLLEWLGNSDEKKIIVMAKLNYEL